MAWSDASSYWPRMSRRRWHSPIDASQNNKLSLANSKWEIWTPPLHDKTPYKFPFFEAFLISPNNPLAQRRNRYGDKWSSCFIPRVGWTKPLLPIYQYRVRCCTNCLHCQLDPPFIQPYFNHHLPKKFSFHLIITFTNFKDRKSVV